MDKILLLEDDLSLIDALSCLLKRQSFELDIARTVKEANTVWRDGKYDLLILDLSLPDGSGFEVCEKVRQVSKVPIIFLTASDEEINIVKGLDIANIQKLSMESIEAALQATALPIVNWIFLIGSLELL